MHRKNLITSPKTRRRILKSKFECLEIFMVQWSTVPRVSQECSKFLSMWPSRFTTSFSLKICHKTDGKHTILEAHYPGPAPVAMNARTPTERRWQLPPVAPVEPVTTKGTRGQLPTGVATWRGTTKGRIWKRQRCTIYAR